MYVAVTRAKDRLTLTYPVNIYDRTTGLVLSKPSRFIEGIGTDILEPWALTDEAEAPAPGSGRGADPDAGFDAYFNQETGW